VAAGTLGAAAVAHGAPIVTSVGAVRRRLTPGLAGIGSPDHVALTFDDGPDPASTPLFLSALDDLGWRATFFLLGDMVRRAPGLAAEVAAAGHEIGVHGDRHDSYLTRLGTDTAADIRRARHEVATATGVWPVWFRPPYGALSTPALVVAHRLGLRTVLWTAWGRDWRAAATARSVASDVRTGLRPGATVLLHDSDCTSAPGSWRATLAALPLLADVFAAEGLRVGPLGDHGIAAR
jgi:peptidoglycan/xylan/chitin deacetylase (PgdA/CDA1 family)